MPELPEVETVARDLGRLIGGATIVGARVFWPKTVRTHSPEGFAEAIAGHEVVGVGRRAKLVVLELSGEAKLTIHLKMTGQLFVVPAGSQPDPYVRLVLELDDGREIHFRDIRKFGRFGLYDASGQPFQALGPEPLDEAFTLKAFRRLIRRRKGRLKSLITDQAFLAGVGNIYADEALWAARLHPLRSAATLRPADERRLYLELRRVLAEAVARRGSSIDDYTAPEGDGSMQERLQVYQRTGEPCPRCGRPVRRIVIGARSTHFCSWCQRLPARDRRGAAAILRGIVPRPGAAPGRRGVRWTELGGGEVIGLPPDDKSGAAARERTERTRRAAATRRAKARSVVGG
jgi:formamidopyrimidine-DNA glycosylase